jgi:hypothetical protein
VDLSVSTNQQVTPLEPFELIYMPYQLQEPKCDWFYVEEGKIKHTHNHLVFPPRLSA